MSETVQKAYNDLMKIAGALEQLEKIENEIGKQHSTDDVNENASYEQVERRIDQPYEEMGAWYAKEPVVPKVEEAGKFDEAPQSYEQALKGASGVNRRFMYPSAKGKKKASYIRKSSYKKLKNSGLGL